MILMVLVQVVLPYGFILHDGEYVIGKDVGPDEAVDFVGFSKSGNLIAGNYDKTQLGDMKAMEGIPLVRLLS